VLAVAAGVGVVAALTPTVLGVVLLLGVVTLAVAIGTLRSSRRSEGLGESRYELLRDHQERPELLREEGRTPSEELERGSQERRQFTEYLEEMDPRLMEHLERRRQARTGSEREVERLEEEGRRLQQRLEEELEQERRKRLEVQQQAEHLEEERRRLEQGHKRVMEELERERRGHQEIIRRAEALERVQTEVSGVQQEAERLRQERQRLAEDLERVREERVEVQKRAERQELELGRLKQELRRSQAEPNHRDRAAARDGATVSGASRPWWRRPILVVGLVLGALIAWFTSLVVALNMLAS